MIISEFAALGYPLVQMMLVSHTLTDCYSPLVTSATCLVKMTWHLLFERSEVSRV